MRGRKSIITEKNTIKDQPKKMQGAKERYYRDPESKRQYQKKNWQKNPEPKNYENNNYDENPELKREDEKKKKKIQGKS